MHAWCTCLNYVSPGHHDPNARSCKNRNAAATQPIRKDAAWRPPRISPVMAPLSGLSTGLRGGWVAVADAWIVMTTRILRIR
ncbi:hypothetical protein Y032_0098g3085 [Ancylostoma ceylanicum]|uniref:Uncharacterized protein n=1 Tax=Ancylostoma ceylanicum TaxID=53326 RepID=A0A016TJF4_9BILA|nr:hypothetical protein Y032_0098g3085 [Ancylostoma ceylanicum]